MNKKGEIINKIHTLLRTSADELAIYECNHPTDECVYETIRNLEEIATLLEQLRKEKDND